MKHHGHKEHKHLHDAHPKQHSEHLKESAHMKPDHMADNKMKHATRQRGIERLLQKKGDMQIGQHGDMSRGWRHDRHTEKLVPRKG